MIMSTVDLNLLVHDPLVMPDGILFSCSAFRASYLVTENRLRAKWLSENRDKWLPIAVAVETALRAGTEGRSNSHDVEMTIPAVTKDNSSMDEKAQEIEPPQPVNSSTMPTRLRNPLTAARKRPISSGPSTGGSFCGSLPATIRWHIHCAIELRLHFDAVTLEKLIRGCWAKVEWVQRPYNDTVKETVEL
jgi:hypothetical protein